MTALAPIHTSFPTVIGFEVLIPPARCTGLIECPAHAMHTPGANPLVIQVLYFLTTQSEHGILHLTVKICLTRRKHFHGK